MTIRVKLSRPENLDWFSCLPETVVAIDMEDYVAAVVASEIGNAPLEACKAQAVAARTYAMPYVGAGKQITDQSGTHQAFRASRWDAVKYPGAAEAARATEGEVLTYKGGVLKTCSFSASNGGRTVSSEARWGGVRPYLIERDDPWDAAASAGAARKGHGVGMSQIGAKWAAEQGGVDREILDFYYPGTGIKPNYGEDGTMAVIIGSARSDEYGRARGGKSGDQTGREVSTQAWYAHAKGWVVLRPRGAAQAAKIAACMRAACDNPCIGYDQGQRNTLYNVAKDVGFDCARVKTKCETDCSALVRVCCAYAGIDAINFNTAGEVKTLMSTGRFDKLTDAKYTKSPDYLRAGDVLVTASKGHTAVVLTDGAKAEKPVRVYKLGDRTLRNGMEGADVKELQTGLITLGFDCGKWGADGEFGDYTEFAVETFQRAKSLVVDGIVEVKTVAALVKAMTDIKPVEIPKKVKIAGGNCYVRTEPSTSGSKLGVVYNGELLDYSGEIYENGWLRVIYKKQDAWVSGKYGQLVD